MPKYYTQLNGKTVPVGFRFLDLCGKTFGSLTVLGLKYCRKRNAHWLCRCACGTKTTVRGTNLKSGRVQSCGCVNPRNTRHGHSPKSGFSSEYFTWMGMKARCNRPGAKSYEDYGARGIMVCPEWNESFAAFLKDMGIKPSPKHTLDRIDTNGHYEPANCRWATKRRQSNNRRNNTILEFRGVRQTVTEWARQLGMNDTTLFMRLYKSKWSVEQALTTPLKT